MFYTQIVKIKALYFLTAWVCFPPRYYILDLGVHHARYTIEKIKALYVLTLWVCLPRYDLLDLAVRIAQYTN